MKNLNKINRVAESCSQFLFYSFIRFQALTTGKYRCLLILFLLMLGLPGQAQDLMTFKNGTEIDCKVLEVNTSMIKYSLPKQGEQFTRVVPVTEVFMVKYESGRKEIFSQQEAVAATTPTDDDDFVGGQKSFAGPRIGFTFVTAGTIQDRLAAKGKRPFVTQFGWQFEKRIFGFRDGPSGMFEFVPLIGGMEQGLFLPSINTLLGLRGGGDQAIEFAVGPNLSLTGVSLVFALGMNFKNRNINFPINIAYVPSIRSVHQQTDQFGGTVNTVTETGHRITLIVGFNVRKK
jgi:hypothetical protein